jgi:hypothetical protein
MKRGRAVPTEGIMKTLKNGENELDKKEKNEALEKRGKNILADVIRDPPRKDRDDVFYFSHERRLEKASQTVKDFNSRKSAKRPGIFAVFTGNRSHTILLVTIAGLCVFISVIAKLSANQNVYKLDGNSIAVSALRYEGKTFIALKKNAGAGAYTGAVDVAVSPDKKKPPGDPAVFTERVYFMPEDYEEFRIAVPMEIEYIIILLQSENASAAIRLKAE